MNVTERQFGLSVRALIRDEQGKLLLIRRSPNSKFFAGLWEVPGGKVEVGETFDQALIREVREETGLTVALEGLAGVTEFFMESKNLSVVALYMKTRLLSEKRTQGTLQWLSPSQFPPAECRTPSLNGILRELQRTILSDQE